MRAPTPSVVYIAGYGRSGSTLLDVVLGNHDRVRGGGELMYLLEELHDPRRRCACQQPYATCDFWRPIAEQVDQGHATRLARLRQLVHRIDGRRGFLGRWLRLAGGRALPGADEYRDLHRALFTAMAGGGADFVVDSSKSARDAAFRPIALRRVAGLDVRVLHLVRGPLCVLRSIRRCSNWQREGHGRGARLRVLRALPGWLLANLCAWTSRWALGRRNYLRVSFGQLTRDPAATLARIGAFLAIDTTQLERMARDGAAFRTGHQAGGNRLRMKPSVTIQRAPAAAGVGAHGLEPRT